MRIFQNEAMQPTNKVTLRVIMSNLTSKEEGF
jgi:hypothetical protein